jgi:glycosyltransferase involved in cell wall biosynthesis
MNDSESQQPLVSVVTPVYNTEEHIGEAIESVLNQTYRNWEYIISNNCSSDRTLDIAKRYAESDSRIKVAAESEFLDQVANYNRALTRISPRSVWCKIVQADDWLFKDCLQRMVETGSRRDSIAIVSAYQLKGPHIGCQGLPYEKTVISGREACRLHLLTRRSLFGNPTSLLYRSELVRGRTPFFDEDSLLEDTEVCYQLLENRDFGFVHRILAYLRVDNDSITSQFEDYNPYLLHELILLKRYGRLYLTEEEFRSRLCTIEKEYDRYLGRAILFGRGGGFWDYHLKGQRAAEYRLSFLKRFRLALGAAFDLALNPKNTLEKLVARLRAR